MFFVIEAWPACIRCVVLGNFTNFVVKFYACLKGIYDVEVLKAPAVRSFFRSSGGGYSFSDAVSASVA